MFVLLIFVMVLGLVLGVAATTGGTWPEDPGWKKMSTGQAIALWVAIAVGALGLSVVGAGIFFALAMSSYGSNK